MSNKTEGQSFNFNGEEDQENEIEEQGNREHQQDFRSTSMNTAWPQSHRQSIDLYISVTPRKIDFSSLSNSFKSLGSSFFTPTPKGQDSFDHLTTHLLPDGTSDLEVRKSSHSLLPTIKDTEDYIKPSGPVQSSYGQAILIGMNVLCGVGLLTTPYAVKEGGWLSLLIFLLFAVLAYYTGILLRWCADSEPGLDTYPDIGQAAFGTTGRVIISIVLYVDLYIGCVEYIILESDNLSSLFPNAQLNIGGLHVSSNVLFAVITTLAVLPTTWLRDLSLLSYVSAGGVIATIVVVANLGWIGLIDQVPLRNEGRALNLSGIPISIGLFGFCFAGHAVFPNLYASMKDRSQYPSVLFASFSFAVVMFGGTAIVGFLMFGESTLSEFTLNMPQNLVASKVAVWTTMVNPIAKYALTFMPIALGMEELIPKRHLTSRHYSIILRTALVLSTLLVALTLPFFGLVMAFAGSFLAMLVSFVFPCICFMSIVKDKLNWKQISLCTITITVGVISAVVGTYSSVSKIVVELS